MLPWDFRSSVVASMLNPALIAAVLVAAAERHETVSGKPLPFELAFVITPLVLHKDTREALPNRRTSQLPNWVADHPTLRAGFPSRSRQMVPFVREGLRFSLRHEVCELTADGGVRGALKSARKPAEGGDIAQIVLKAGFLGGWLTKWDSPTIYALLGIQP